MKILIELEEIEIKAIRRMCEGMATHSQIPEYRERARSIAAKCTEAINHHRQRAKQVRVLSRQQPQTFRGVSIE